MNALIEEHNLILTEAAIVERLRRTGVVELHPRLVHATLVYDDRGRLVASDTRDRFGRQCVSAGAGYTMFCAAVT